MDWKEQLSALKGSDHRVETSPEKEPKTAIKKDPLRIELEKRNGKPVTFVSGFLSSETEIEQISKALKVRCGCGGSQKEREIMIQGDVREKISRYLTEMGYSKIKIMGQK